MKTNIEYTPEILFLTSYPPRQCGIATYSQDLIKALNNKFSGSFSIKVCALESGEATFHYPAEVKYTLKTSLSEAYHQLAQTINNDKPLKIVLIQHEYGFFQKQEEAFLQFLYLLIKPVVIVFHTVLPKVDVILNEKVNRIANACEAIIVMTNNSAKILVEDYDILPAKITVIPHGTHLVLHENKELLKEKYVLKGRKVLSTFGLISSGKSIETTLEALPAIINENHEIVFLVIGKTHPEVVKIEGEKYREYLESIVKLYELENHVVFINSYLTTPVLLEYLQLTDIYLFTSIDPNQAVSGTFSYAMSCACPIISTPIPHAKEVLTKDTGIIVDFKDLRQLAENIILLLNNDPLRNALSINTLQNIVSSAWENSAVAHAMLLNKTSVSKIPLRFSLPEININHIKRMTTNIGIIQFSKINQPDIDSGYTLDDNARALIALCMHYEMSGIKKDLIYIKKYFNFIKYCQQPSGNFLNYADKDKTFTEQNYSVNLDDANGRAVWALGYLVSLKKSLPDEIISDAEAVIHKILPNLETIHSARAMAFVIKGLYYLNSTTNSSENLSIIKTLANRLVDMYKHESDAEWNWFEDSLTYANSVLPEAVLDAWMLIGEPIYKKIAMSSFDFLLSKTFNENGIEVISNKNWLQKGAEKCPFGEQPIDVAYTILALSNFYDAFKKDTYFQKMKIAFDWFLGNNRLHQIVYNPCTGGCYDGMEENNVNLNQGAESAVSYLMARLTVEKYLNPEETSDKLSAHNRKRSKRDGTFRQQLIKR
ncbi:MAG: glycosyltransferase [Chitinophagaceae bacterium]